MRSDGREKHLLSSIMEKGIEEPLCGVQTSSAVPVLLDGFKRLRCAEKLKISHVPFQSLGEDEATAISSLLRLSNAKNLTFVEQAKLVDELKRVYGLNVIQIAKRVDRSQAWVCTRINVLSEMSEQVMNAILLGRFPAYSFFYTLRQFRRLNGVPKSDIDDFVKVVSGHDCSTRDIELLANGYLRGGEKIREQIRQDFSWYLGQLNVRASCQGPVKLSSFESSVLRDLEITQSCMNRLTLKLHNEELKASDFFAQAGLIADGILSRGHGFLDELRRFCDRIGKA